MSVSPGRRNSPELCHNRRQGKRSAQKQIICPIYRGWPSGRPYRLGLEPQFFAPAWRMGPPQKLRGDSLLERYPNTANLAGTWDPPAAPAGPDFQRESRKCRLFGRESERRLGIRRRNHEIVDARHDFRLEARAVEHAVVSDALLNVLHAPM